MARLTLLDLLVTVVEHRQEVLELISSSATPAEAEANISARFDVSETYLSQAVLNLQLHRLTESERIKIAAEADEVRAHFGL